MAANRRSICEDYREFRQLYLDRDVLRLVSALGTPRQNFRHRKIANFGDKHTSSPRRLRRETYSVRDSGRDRSRHVTETVNRIQVLANSPRAVPMRRSIQHYTPTTVTAQWVLGGPVRSTAHPPALGDIRRHTVRYKVPCRNERTSYPRTTHHDHIHVCAKDQCPVRPFSKWLPGSNIPSCHCERTSVYMGDYGLTASEGCTDHGQHNCGLRLCFCAAASVYFPFRNCRYRVQKKKPSKYEYDTLDLIQLRRLLPPARVGEKVIFRDPDDGWYYEGMVTLDCKNYMYVVVDGNNHQETVWREEIICPDEMVINDLKVGDKVLVHHPEYRDSYAPGEVSLLADEGSVTVKLFGQKKAKLKHVDIRSKLFERMYESSVVMIKNLALAWVNEDVVARTKTGEYHIGTVVNLEGEDYSKFRIRWKQNDDFTEDHHQTPDITGDERLLEQQQNAAGEAANTKGEHDNNLDKNVEHEVENNERRAETQKSLSSEEQDEEEVQKQEKEKVEEKKKEEVKKKEKEVKEEVVQAIHVFGPLTPVRGINSVDYVLAPTETFCYLPGTVIARSEEMVDVTFDINRGSAKKVNVDECFWISTSYYHDAITHYINASD